MSVRIGICDSGIGGLSVLKELYRNIPAEYIYIGDSLRAPYGNKTPEELISYTKELLTFLQSHHVDIYVSACNSISTVDTEALLDTLGIKSENYVDMRDFAACAQKSIQDDARLLIFGTVATTTSGVYQDVFAEWNPDVLASRGLAYAIETGHQIEIDDEVDVLVDYVIENNITQILLACTHYPLIIDYLEKRLAGLSVTLLDPATYIPEKLRSIQGEKRSLAVYTTKDGEVMHQYVREIDDVVPVCIEI